VVTERPTFSIQDRKKFMRERERKREREGEEDKSNTSIVFLNHASFIIQQNKIKILNDPYLFGSAFNDGWNLLKEFDHSDCIKNLTHIYFSHEHPDHFSIPFLKSISAEERKKITIIYQETYDKRVENFCKKLGYNFQEIRNLKEIKISENFYITIGKVPFYDSWINYRVNNKNILNINDCELEDPDVAFLIKKKIQNIDVLFSQYSYANFIPENQRINNAINCLKKIKLQDIILKPSFIVPFASLIYFSHKENYFMNKNINTMQSAHDYIKENCKAFPIILKPNENWAINKKDNYKSLDFWNKLYKNIPNLQLNDNILNVDSKSLIEKSKKYLERIKKNNNNLLIYILYKLKFFNDISIFITDLRKCFDFNVLEGLKENQIYKNEFTIEMSSNSLQFIFDYDYGMDTLFVNARFKTTSNNMKKVMRNFIIGSLNNTGRYIKLNNIPKFFNKLMLKKTIKLLFN
jgi:UDP-MurNAc hydroxylase